MAAATAPILQPAGPSGCYPRRSTVLRVVTMIEVATGFRIQAITPAALRVLRQPAREGFGNAMTVSVTEEPGAPLRCCLRDAIAGERIALIAYRPFTVDGPYAEVG